MNKEEIYDSEISPLMKQVIAICNAHGIAMVSSFHIPNAECSDLACTTRLPDENGNHLHDYRDISFSAMQEAKGRMHVIDNNLVAFIDAEMRGIKQREPSKNPLFEQFKIGEYQGLSRCLNVHTRCLNSEWRGLGDFAMRLRQRVGL